MKAEAASASVVRGGLLAVWAAVSFGLSFFAREIDQLVAGWPVNYWFAAQGSVLIFIGIVMGYAGWMNRREEAGESDRHDEHDEAEAPDGEDGGGRVR